MHLSVGHTYSSSVSLYVHAMNYSETDKLKINHLDKVNEPYILLQMTVIARKKNPNKNLPCKLCKAKGKCQFSRVKTTPLHDIPEKKVRKLEESVQSIIVITTNRVG